MSDSPQQPIRLMMTNPLWPQEFEQSKSSVLQAAEGWIVDVQHIGSTYLKDGVARPIVDMLAGMDDLQGLNKAADLVEGLNYSRVETPEWCSSELSAFLRKPRAGEVTHTVLLLRRGGECWSRALAIRDWLASHLADWQTFQNVKKENWTRGCEAQQKYAMAKDLFFASLEDQIAGVD